MEVAAVLKVGKFLHHQESLLDQEQIPPSPDGMRHMASLGEAGTCLAGPGS
jgi:hypothetical protein